MIKYSLEIIPGTLKYVALELNEKFPNAVIISEKKNELIFEAENNDVDDFRELLSPLRISKENGPTRNLYRRDWKIQSVPAGINPSLGFIMCMIGKINSEDVVFDPFCGAGTIGISAAKYFNAKKVICSDLSGKAVDYTVENLKTANLDKNVMTVFRSNVSMLKLQNETFSKIVTNLPFGIRVGDHESNKQIYKTFLTKAYSLLKDKGRIVCLTQDKKLILDLYKNPGGKGYGFRFIDEIIVEQGGLYPSIFVLEKNTRKI